MMIQIRQALPSDGTVLHTMIKELAEFEKAVHEVQSTPELLSRHLTEDPPPFQAYIASVGKDTAGFALFFYSYSTWRAKQGVWLEDLYVRPKFRRKGVGSALFNSILSQAKIRGAGRLEWPVLEWNTDAHRFYESHGAMPLDQWRTWRLSLA